MNVVVLGAGTVGNSIADMLCQHHVNVTVVDIDPEKTERINEDFDVRVVTGSASQSSILFQTGISTADMCLAVTGNDEVNIVAASMAKAMGARRSVARVYSPVFRDLSTFDYQRHFEIDRMLSLEHLTAVELARGIRDPGSVVIEEFARGGLEAFEVRVTKKSSAIGKAIRDIGLSAGVRIGTIKRGNRMWIASADDKLMIDDQITIFSGADTTNEVNSIFRRAKSSHLKVVIAGGGETGFHLASMLEREGFSVKLLEQNQSRCDQLANSLKKTNIIHCDATARNVLEEERVGAADVFVACTGDDENNIVACVEAREIGAKKIMAVVGRSDYGNIVGKLGIELAVSEREVMAKQILSFLNDGALISKTQLPGGLINIVEIEVVENSPATKCTLRSLPLPDRCQVVAAVQHDFVRVPKADDRLLAGNIAILLVEDDVLDAAVRQFTVTET